MIKLIAALALATAAVAAPAAAHPTGIPYASRGECQTAFAHYSKLDRIRISELFGVSPGAAQSPIHDLYACEYDGEEDAWFIVYIGG